MGYAVYEDRDNNRWAGYGVPGECDWPTCQKRIDRGLGHKCEEHVWYEQPDDDDDIEHADEGCGLFFCEEHRYRTEEHDPIAAKPDSREWIMHQLIDPTWAEWRNKYPDAVRAQQQLLIAAQGATA